MKHVFVETNWVVDCCAPAHLRQLAALELLRAANSGAIQLHLPGPCLTEARSVIRNRFQPREADKIRQYLKWAQANRHTDAATAQTLRGVLDQFEHLVNQDLDNLQARIEGLKKEAGLHVFALTAEMLEKSISLAESLDLKPFDNSILAAILVQANRLAKQGEADIVFCELDGDLQWWPKKEGNPKPVLTRLYQKARVWVYGDFTMTTPERPKNW
jgi:hypothetical protein